MKLIGLGNSKVHQEIGSSSTTGIKIDNSI